MEYQIGQVVGTQGAMTRRSARKRMMTVPSSPPGAAFVPLGKGRGRVAPLGREKSRISIGSATASLSLSTSAASLEDDAFLRGGGQSSLQRIPRPDEPNLFNIPADLSPIYRPMPMLLQIAIIVASISLVGRRGLAQCFTTSRSAMLKQLMAPLTERLLSVSVIRKSIWFLLRTALVSTLAKLGIQEAFYMPSRVTTQYLADRDELPSKLSNYQVVTPVPVSAPTNIQEKSESTTSWDEDDVPAAAPLGVHSIQYTQQSKNEDTGSSKQKYDGIYLNHGFGAMSLSWLPVLPSLVDGLGTGNAVGAAHDNPGFGFTDRPDANADGGLHQYGFENNAGIGLTLMNNLLFKRDEVDSEGAKINPDTKEPKSVALFGHSMGSKASLLMALEYAKHPEFGVKPKLVVLVAPALEGATLPSRKGRSLKSTKQRSSKGSNGWVGRIAKKVYLTWKRIFVDTPLQYGLRRAVSGTSTFWRKGLSLAWGDANTLSDSDVLRYQWPSIGRGWEEGVINFARARILSSPSPNTLDDLQILKIVADLKDTKVVIVYGSKDPVVPIEGSVAETLKREIPNLRLVRIEGAGHNPFEESTHVDEFMVELEKALD